MRWLSKKSQWYLQLVKKCKHLKKTNHFITLDSSKQLQIKIKSWQNTMSYVFTILNAFKNENTNVKEIGMI